MMLFTRNELVLLCKIPDNWYWLCTLVFIIFCGFFFYQCYRSILKARHLEDTPTSKIRSATQGYVELNGTQIPSPHESLHAFLSHKPCTWYRYTIEIWRDNGWQLIEAGNSHGIFAIDDGTGVCFIDPHGAEISTPICHRWKGSKRYPSKAPEGFLARLLGGTGSYRYCEWRMEQGMPIYAAGNFLTLSQSMLDTPEKTKQVSQLNKNWQKHQQPFLVMFARGGFLALRGVAQKPPHKPKPAKPNLSPTIHVLSNYGLDKRHPFIISGKSERHLVKGYKFDAFVWGLAFVGLFTFTAFLVHFKLSC